MSHKKKLDIKDLFTNYLSFERYLLKNEHIYSEIFFSNLITVLKDKLNIDCLIDFNNNELYSKEIKNKNQDYVKFQILLENNKIQLSFYNQNLTGLYKDIYIDIFKNITILIEEKLLKDKNSILNIILNRLPAFVWYLDNKGTFKYSFGSALKFLNLVENELNGLNIYDVYSEHADAIMSTLDTGYTNYLAKGETDNKEWYFDNFVFKEKNGQGLFCFSLNVTDRIKTEELLKKSLNEKDTLIKEIHHRVKNNMQVISSLLSLQSSQVKEKTIKNLFLQSQNRIRAMALVHETLYQSETLSEINFDKYMNDLIISISHLFGKKNTRCLINANDVYLDINLAIPCGLIINELVSNCFKYAFDYEQEECLIKISIENSDKNKILIVEDNGKGFPRHIDFENTDSLGLQLVTSLVSQINGQIKLLSEKGTKFIITF